MRFIPHGLQKNPNDHDLASGRDRCEGKPRNCRAIQTETSSRTSVPSSQPLIITVPPVGSVYLLPCLPSLLQCHKCLLYVIAVTLTRDLGLFGYSGGKC